MKKTIAILASIGLANAAWAGEQSSVTSTNAHPELERAGFAYVEPALEQQKNLDTALVAVKLERKMDKACETIEDARALLWRSINIPIATGSGPLGWCTEYQGYFWFSRLGTLLRDSSFKSGLAVKKGTGEIYRWEEGKAQAGRGE